MAAFAIAVSEPRGTRARCRPSARPKGCPPRSRWFAVTWRERRTICALLISVEQKRLVDVEKVPSEKGSPRKVYSLNAEGREFVEESGTHGASSPNGSDSSTKEAKNQETNLIKKVIGDKGQWREYRARGRQLPASYRMALDAFERRHGLVRRG